MAWWTPNSTVVVVGAGQAGAELAIALRREGFGGRVVVIGAEAHPPYQRPPLSKAFLATEQEQDALWLRPPASYEKAGIEVRLGKRVVNVDRSRRVVVMDDGERLAYDKLAFATGGRSRNLPGVRANVENLHTIRTAADSLALRARLARGGRLVVIGGGFIGLEVAATAQARGFSVTIIESRPALLTRAASPVVGLYLQLMHQEHGVDVRTRTEVRDLRYDRDGRIEAVALSDGAVLAADEVVAGIGMIANTELAASAGLEVAEGISVDVHACTSDPLIVAAGDCAMATHALNPHPVRLESVCHATEQARVAAATLSESPKSTRRCRGSGPISSRLRCV